MILNTQITAMFKNLYWFSVSGYTSKCLCWATMSYMQSEAKISEELTSPILTCPYTVPISRWLVLGATTSRGWVGGDQRCNLFISGVHTLELPPREFCIAPSHLFPESIQIGFIQVNFYGGKKMVRLLSFISSAVLRFAFLIILGCISCDHIGFHMIFYSVL